MQDRKFVVFDDEYTAVPKYPGRPSCYGCAGSVSAKICSALPDDCTASGIIWIRTESPEAAVAEMTQAAQADGLHEPMEGSKPTNPKDAIGIRKAPMSCLPMNVVAEAGTALLEGAAKYGRHNFRAVGVRGSVYFDATMRHLVSWWEGEDLDPDSGLSHVTKAIASLVVLRDSMLRENWTDDRPPKSPAFYPRLNERAAAVLDRHADKNPVHYTEISAA